MQGVLRHPGRGHLMDSRSLKVIKQLAEKKIGDLQIPASYKKKNGNKKPWEPEGKTLQRGTNNRKIPSFLATILPQPQ